jgi:hypothetical protein
LGGRSTKISFETILFSTSNSNRSPVTSTEVDHTPSRVSLWVRRMVARVWRRSGAVPSKIIPQLIRCEVGRRNLDRVPEGQPTRLNPHTIGGNPEVKTDEVDNKVPHAILPPVGLAANVRQMYKKIVLLHRCVECSPP